jgi:hypothetical protein
METFRERVPYEHIAYLKPKHLMPFFYQFLNDKNPEIREVCSNMFRWQLNALPISAHRPN